MAQQTLKKGANSKRSAIKQLMKQYKCNDPFDAIIKYVDSKQKPQTNGKK